MTSIVMVMVMPHRITQITATLLRVDVAIKKAVVVEVIAKEGKWRG